MAQTEGNDRIKVLLVDDHAIIREGLCLLLAAQPNMKVVGQAGNGREALAAAESEHPDIILLDIDMGAENGLDLLPKLLAAAPKAQALILTSAREQETHERAMRIGALGLVSKEKVGAVLVKAIEKVHAGEVWFDRATMGAVLSGRARGAGPKVDPNAERIATLTPRELEVVALLCEGLKNKQIGERLFISETTVRHHLTSIFGKLDVTDRLELLLYAFRHGLAKPPNGEQS